MVIEVVLPTYNGVSYLEDQLASIYCQTLRPVRVLLRDDGSFDGTPSMIAQLKQRYGGWLEVLPAGDHLGCTANVNRLLEKTTAPYVALADQDDVWLSQKLEQSLALLQALEVSFGNSTPLLVHSDLELVDSQAQPMGCGYFQRQHLDPKRTNLADLALTNVVTGCTALFNRSLLQIALPIPPEALMHDWWLALVASAFGTIALVEEPGVLYRQHDRNVLGSQGLGLLYWLHRLRQFLADPTAGVSIRAVQQQAVRFEELYALSISVLPQMLSLPRWKRWLALFKLAPDQKPSKHGPLRTMGLYSLLLCLPR